MKKFYIFVILVLANNLLVAVEKTGKSDLEIGKKYYVSAGPLENQKVKLLGTISLTYQLTRKDNNPEIHNIVVERIKNHPEKENLIKQLQHHRTNSSLDQLFEELPTSIKETPIYSVETEQGKTHCVERSWLKIN